MTCDDFGVKRVYPSDRISSADDRLSAWTRPSPTILSVAGDLDPLDRRSMMEGIGAIGLGYGECMMVGDARLYIGSSAAHGWADVEVTTYGRVVGESSATALIIGVLANHSDFGEGCSRPAYSARIDVHTGPSGNAEFYTSLFRSSTSLVHGSTKWATIAKPTNFSNCRRCHHRRHRRHHHHHECCCCCRHHRHRPTTPMTSMTAAAAPNATAGPPRHYPGSACSSSSEP